MTRHRDTHPLNQGLAQDACLNLAKLISSPSLSLSHLFSIPFPSPFGRRSGELGGLVAQGRGGEGGEGKGRERKKRKEVGRVGGGDGREVSEGKK